MTSTSDLPELRQRIDELDRQLVELVAARLDVCREVARIKEGTGATVIQPDRVREVLATRRQWAIDAGVDADFAEQLFRTLLAETHRIEVAGARPEPAPVKLAGSHGASALDTVACRIDHVVVAVADLSAAGDFFTGLGFTVRPTEDDGIAVAEAGGVTVVLVAPGPSDPDGHVADYLGRHGSGVQHIAIEVLNAGFTQSSLAAGGVPLLTDVVVDEDGHEQLFTVHDERTGVQLGFISRTGHRVPMRAANVRRLFDALAAD